jgi:hypothetical protein
MYLISRLQVKEANAYSIFKSKTIWLEQYKLFPQNYFIFVNTALSLLVLSRGFFATYKNLSFSDLQQKKIIINHFVSQSLLCVQLTENPTLKEIILGEMRISLAV